MIIMAVSSIEDPNDRQFMEELYEENKALMLAKARKYLSDPADCEDVVQEAVVKLIEKIPELRGKKRCVLRAYIVSTVRSTSIDHLRRQGARGAHTVPLEEAEDTALPAPSLDELAALAEGREQLARIWPLLSGEDQLLLERRYVLDCSNKELAGLMGCTEAGVRMKLTRARRRALRLLTEQGRDER